MGHKVTSLTMETLSNPKYNPVALLDLVKEKTGIKSDYALAKKSGVFHVVISKVRNLRIGISCEVLLAMHELSGIPMAELKSAAGLSSVARYVPEEKPDGV